MVDIFGRDVLENVVAKSPLSFPYLLFIDDFGVHRSLDFSLTRQIRLALCGVTAWNADGVPESFCQQGKKLVY